MINQPRISRRHSLLLRWAVISLAATLLVTVAVAYSSRQKRLYIPAANAHLEGLTNVLQRSANLAHSPIRFEDVTATMGIDFRHFPAERSSLIAEDMGSGVAWGDFDGDGFVDLFAVNFAGPATPGAPRDPQRGKSRLFRNVNGQHFEDVTDAAGLDFAGYGMSAAWGDYDGDGDVDLYIAGLGDNALYENVGGGRFQDVTDRAGVQDRRFSAGCSWADYDRDGDLDLYVCNYIDFVFREADLQRRDPKYAEQPWTTNPAAYQPVANALFRNNGDGTFTDVALAAGVTDPQGRSLSASWFDMDNDGWPDLYVADDVSKNAVFRNRGDGTFEDIGAASLAADYRSAMGLAVADLDNDLDLDLFITHWIAQENAFYRNMVRDAAAEAPAGGRLWFLDAADELGLGQIALDMVGWATGFCDLDNDGRLDLWLVNGHTFEEQRDGHRVLVPQAPFVFWNRGSDGFVEIAAQTCPRLAEKFVGRGGAQADFDNDGRVDLALLVHQGPLLVLRNVSPAHNHWLELKLRQTAGNTGALGARAVVTSCGQTRMAEVGAGSSYLSQHDSTLHFGLGECAAAEQVCITWPDGSRETYADLAVDRQHLLTHVAAPTAP